MTNKQTGIEEIADAINRTMMSPNVWDSNGEPANVVDALNYIANGLHHVAAALKEIADAQRQSPGAQDL